MSSGSLLIRLLNALVKGEGSDLHLKVGKKPTVRIHGVLRELETVIITNDSMNTIKNEALACSSIPNAFSIQFEEEGSCDFSFQAKFEDDLRSFRVNLCKVEDAPSLVIRLVSNKAPSVLELNFGREFLNCLERQHGLVLITGATGSGKSTTLASIIEYFNINKRWRIVTVESPIEYYFSNIGFSFITQREVPKHTKTYTARELNFR